MELNRRDFLKLGLAATATMAFAGLPPIELQKNEKIISRLLDDFEVRLRMGTQRLMGSLDNKSPMYLEHKAPIGLMDGKHFLVGDSLESLSMSYNMPLLNGEGLKFNLTDLAPEKINFDVEVSGDPNYQQFSYERRPLEITGANFASSLGLDWHNAFSGLVITFYDCRFRSMNYNVYTGARILSFDAINVPQLNNQIMNIYAF